MIHSTSTNARYLLLIATESVKSEHTTGHPAKVMNFGVQAMGYPAVGTEVMLGHLPKLIVQWQSLQLVGSQSQGSLAIKDFVLRCSSPSYIGPLPLS